MAMKIALKLDQMKETTINKMEAALSGNVELVMKELRKENPKLLAKAPFWDAVVAGVGSTSICLVVLPNPLYRRQYIGFNPSEVSRYLICPLSPSL
jgi:hypothetical protein